MNILVYQYIAKHFSQIANGASYCLKFCKQKHYDSNVL